MTSKPIVEMLCGVDRVMMRSVSSLVAELVGDDWGRTEIINTASFAAAVHAAIRFHSLENPTGVGPFSIEVVERIAGWSEEQAMRFVGTVHVCEIVGRASDLSSDEWKLKATRVGKGHGLTQDEISMFCELARDVPDQEKRFSRIQQSMTLILGAQLGLPEDLGPVGDLFWAHFLVDVLRDYQRRSSDRQWLSVVHSMAGWQ